MNQPIRILYVDDYPLDRELVRDALEKENAGFEVVEACSRAQFETMLAQSGFDLVLSDFNILGFEGLQVLEIVRAKDSHLPVIIVTGTGSEEIAAEAIKRGAADYVIKTPKHIQRLPHTIQATLEKKQFEYERRLAEDAVKESNVLLALFIKHSPIYAFIKQVTATQSRVLMASENFQDMVGIPGSKMAGMSMEELFPPEFAAKMTADDQAVIAGGKVLRLDEDLNGRSYTTIKFPILQGGKKLLAGYSIDVTERKQGDLENQRRLIDLQVLYESSLRLSSQLAPVEIGRSIIEILKEQLNWHHAIVRIRKEDSEELQIIGYAAPDVTPDNYAAEISRLHNLDGRTGRGMQSWVIEHAEGVRSGDLPSDPRYIETHPGTRSGLYSPLISGEKVIGIIAIESHDPQAFNEHDERLLATLSKITANAIHRNLLREQTETRMQHLLALRTVDMAISSSFDINMTLGILLDQIVRLLGADAVDILAFNQATQTFKFSCERGFRSHLINRTQIRFGAGYAWQVVKERQMVIVQDVRQGPDGLQRAPDLSGEQIITYVGVPLLAKGQVKGVLEVFQREPRVLEAERRDFLEMLAGQAAIAIDNYELFEHLESSNAELGMAYDSTLEGWANALELRDKETEGHTRRVAELATRLAQSLGVLENNLLQIYRGALLHDIGKMGVPDSIVLKPGPLTDEEWVIMRKHPQYAYDMLSPIAYLRPAIDIPYCHHERWDGTGYPRGLKREQIPLAARIFAVVDVWDALISDRSYRKAWPEEKAYQYIQDQAGLHFDPQMVRTFLERNDY